MICRHCQRGFTFARGLCRPCYSSPRIRYRYPPTYSIGTPDLVGPRQPLPEPTDALPGSERKMTVMAERLSLGQQLFHPLDATGVE